MLFGHAVDDDFIRPHHSDRIFESYVVSCFFLVIEFDKEFLRYGTAYWKKKHGNSIYIYIYMYMVPLPFN